MGGWVGGWVGGLMGGSSPFFYEPNFDTLVSCLPGFCQEGRWVGGLMLGSSSFQPTCVVVFHFNHSPTYHPTHSSSYSSTQPPTVLILPLPIHPPTYPL